MSLQRYQTSDVVIIIMRGYVISFDEKKIFLI